MITEDLYTVGFNENTRVALVSLVVDLLAELPPEKLSALLSASQAAAAGPAGEPNSAEAAYIEAWQKRVALLSMAQSQAAPE